MCILLHPFRLPRKEIAHNPVFAALHLQLVFLRFELVMFSRAFCNRGRVYRTPHWLLVFPRLLQRRSTLVSCFPALFAGFTFPAIYEEKMFSRALPRLYPLNRTSIGDCNVIALVKYPTVMEKLIKSVSLFSV